eukprot:tig00001343_g8330.t1
MNAAAHLTRAAEMLFKMGMYRMNDPLMYFSMSKAAIFLLEFGLELERVSWNEHVNTGSKETGQRGRPNKWLERPGLNRLRPLLIRLPSYEEMLELHFEKNPRSKIVGTDSDPRLRDPVAPQFRATRDAFFDASFPSHEESHV